MGNAAEPSAKKYVAVGLVDLNPKDLATHVSGKPLGGKQATKREVVKVSNVNVWKANLNRIGSAVRSPANVSNNEKAVVKIGGRQAAGRRRSYYQGY